MSKPILLAVLMVTITMLPFAYASDGDGDGISDSIDACPFAEGYANSTSGNGCPDSDGDGLADFEQATYQDWNEAGSMQISKGTTEGSVNAVAWAKNNSVFFAGSNSNNVSVYDENGVFIKHLYAMQGDITDIEISPDGTRLVVGSKNGGCVVLNSTTGNLVSDLWNGTTNGDIYEVGWSRDDTRIFCGGFNRILKSYYASNYSFEKNFPEMPGWISGIDTTPDGRIVFASGNRQIYGFWTENETEYLHQTNHSNYVRVLTVSPDGRYLATGSHDSTVIITEISTKSIIKTLTFDTQVYDIDFSSDGGSMLVAIGWRTSFSVFRTDTWSTIGTIEGFGTTEGNRGVHAAEFNEDGNKIAIGWRRGWVSVIGSSDFVINVKGLNYTEQIENHWQSTYTSSNHVVDVKESTRLMTTMDLCDSKDSIGSYINGVSPELASKEANYSRTGIWECDNTDEEILEIPYGRAAGALMVKSGGDTQACIEAIGGLSLAQVRWIISGSSRSVLTSAGEMPGINWASVVPSDDNDGYKEWSDLHSSCPDEEVVYVQRTDNQSEISIIKEVLLCENCQQKDYFYASTNARPRFDAGIDIQNVTNMMKSSGADGSIGFTELVHTLDNSNGLYLVPIVDNLTHGAVDVISTGGHAVNASFNTSRDGEWPLQTDMRAFSSVDNLNKTSPFLRYLLSEVAQMKWEQIGFVGLGVWDLYLTWGKLGVDMYHILPDADMDGVWDGDDICPNTEVGLSVNDVGCPENELDDDNDGFTNDIDDCDDVAGTSLFDKVGCPDQDGDGWEDSNDTHPNDSTEWNDTDMDGFGDNSDDCIDLFGNSTQGSLGCPDADGDTWADLNDAFVNDSSEWFDFDGDGYGNNIDEFPYEPTQWLDSDSDGFGDNNSGLEGDDCVDVAGTSNKDGWFGCLDSDGDGWADTMDDLPSDPLQHIDADGDGVGDSISPSDFDMCPETSPEERSMIDSNGCGPSERDGDYDTFTDDIDQCPSTPLLKTTLVNTTVYLDSAKTVINPLVGCAPSEVDLDGDGVTADLDWDDNNANQSIDSDGDGFGDNSDSPDGDDCPLQKGTSTKDKRGCLDLDSDGWSYETDFNDGDPTQWKDTDGDGFGDNYGDMDWSEGRIIGQYVEGATQPDRCPDEYSAFLYSDTQGCLTSLQSSDGTEQNTAESKDDEEESNLVLILSLAATGIIFVLFGAIAVLLRKKPSTKTADEIGPVHPALENKKSKQVEKDTKDEPKSVEEEIDSKDPVEFVSTWEELPTGEWLPNDEHGVNWYQDEDGRYWHSTDDGFRVWNE